MGSRLAILVALAVMAGTACAPKVRLDDPSPFEDDDPRAGNVAKSGHWEARAEAPMTEGRARGGEIERHVLNEVLDRGPGAFLRGVEVSAQFADDRFTGWRVVEFMPTEHRFDPYDLVPGDVIARVNGRQISRPDHLHELWEELRDTDAIVVSVQRAGAPFELRFDVVE